MNSTTRSLGLGIPQRVQLGTNSSQIPFTQKFAELAQTRRVDMISIGDSNQIFSGHGWDQGWGEALIKRFNWYGTSLFGATDSEDTGSGNGVDGTGVVGITGYSLARKALPTNLMNYWMGDAVSQLYQPFYLEQGASIACNNRYMSFNTRLFKKAGQSLVKSKLRQSFQIGMIPGSAGQARYFSRLQQPGFDTILNNPIIYNNDTSQMCWISNITENWIANNLDLADYPFSNALSERSVAQLVGPFAYLYQDVDFPDITIGLRHSTFIYKGGVPTKTLANAMINATDLSLQNYLQSIVRLQSGDKILLVRICEGLNDRSDATNSVGSNPAAGNTANGFADNTIAIIDRLNTIWISLGYNASNLGFLITPSHIQETNDSSLLFARNGANLVKAARPNVVVCNLAELVPKSVMDSGNGTGTSFYDTGGTPHLKQAGYEYIADVEATNVFGF